MGTRLVRIHDKCTKCDKILHSISEGERGLCSSCWVETLDPETKKSLNRLVSLAFKKSSSKERELAVDDAMRRLKEEEGKRI